MSEFSGMFPDELSDCVTVMGLYVLPVLLTYSVWRKGRWIRGIFCPLLFL